MRYALLWMALVLSSGLIAAHAYRSPLAQPRRKLFADFVHSDQQNWPGCSPSDGPGSPIDLNMELPGLTDSSNRFSLSLGGAQRREIENKPYTLELKANNEAGTFYRDDGSTFQGQLAQLHFHGPAEHTLNGETFDLELHLVFLQGGNPAAVVGVLFRAGGSDNPALTPLVEALSASDSEAEVDLSALVPGGSYYTYDGSLTTPTPNNGGCLPGKIRWHVMTNVQGVSTEQLAVIKAKWGNYGDNHRAVQPYQAGHRAKLVN